MPSRHPRHRAKPHVLLWIVLGSVAVIGLSVGTYFAFKGSGKTSQGTTGDLGSPGDGLPRFGRAALDPKDVENTRDWAADAVKRLKDAKASELAHVEKELKDSLLGKQVRWTFPVEAVDGGEVKLDSFFGTSEGQFRGDHPKLKGKPMRRLYLRVYFDSEQDAVKVGDEVTEAEASRLRKGSKWTVVRTVMEVMVGKRDDQWVSASSYSDVVDVLEPYCITVVLSRK